MENTLQIKKLTTHVIMNKILGLILLFLSYRSFVYGIKFKDTGHGAKLTNVRAIGVSLLLLIIGIAALFTDKTFCEVFNIFC